MKIRIIDHTLLLGNFILILTLLLLDTNSDDNIVSFWGWTSGVIGFIIYLISLSRLIKDNKEKNILSKLAKKELLFSFKKYLWNFKEIIHELTTGKYVQVYDRQPYFKRHWEYLHPKPNAKLEYAESWEYSPEYFFKTIYNDKESWDFLKPELIHFTNKTGKQWAELFYNSTDVFAIEMEQILLKYKGDISPKIAESYHNLKDCSMFNKFGRYLKEDLQYHTKNYETDFEIYKIFYWSNIGIGEIEWKEYTDNLIKFMKSIDK